MAAQESKYHSRQQNGGWILPKVKPFMQGSTVQWLHSFFPKMQQAVFHFSMMAVNRQRSTWGIRWFRCHLTVVSLRIPARISGPWVNKTDKAHGIWGACLSTWTSPRKQNVLPFLPGIHLYNHKDNKFKSHGKGY